MSMVILDLAHLLQSKTEEDAPLRRQLTLISHAVAKSKKAVVVSGAGISCSCGIPDFRSSDGLYNLVKARYPTAFVTGKDLFSSSLFRSPESTSLFYSFIAELKLAASAAQPSPTHWFIKKLDDKGKLMRSYTQNIDGMEKRVGVRCSSTPDWEVASVAAEASSRESSPGVAGPSSQASTSSSARQPLSSQASFASQATSFPSSSQASSSPTPRRSSSVISSSSSSGGVTMDKKLTKNIQLHGDIHRVRCKVCSASYDFTDEYVEIFREGDAPDCPACEMRAQDRQIQSKRPLAAGVLRPAIVLYDENHPNGDLIGSLQSHDLTRTPDLLLVLGTSLKVHGLKRLVKELARSVHSLPVTAARPNGGRGRVIFVNKTPPQGAEWKGVFDYWVKGECDEWVKRVEEEWRKVKKSDWETQTTLDGSKIVKAPGPAAAGKPVKVAPIPKAKAKAALPKVVKPQPEPIVEVVIDIPGIDFGGPLQWDRHPRIADRSSPLSSPPAVFSDLPSVSQPTPKPPLSPSKRGRNSTPRPTSALAVKRPRPSTFQDESGEKENTGVDDDDVFGGAPMDLVDLKGKGKASAVTNARPTKLGGTRSADRLVTPPPPVVPAARRSKSTASISAAAVGALSQAFVSTKPSTRPSTKPKPASHPRLGMGRARAGSITGI